jgi:predicted nucleotidyltransferase
MPLSEVIKRQRAKRLALRKEALKEAKRLNLLLRERFEFEDIYIFGSVLTNRFSFKSDIDLAIKGLKTEDFFKAHAFLIRECGFAIDLKPFEDMTIELQKTVLLKGDRLG